MSETKTQRRIRVRTRLAEMLEQGYDKSKIYSKTKLYENDKIIEANEGEKYTIQYCEKCNGFEVFFGGCVSCLNKNKKGPGECSICGEYNSKRDNCCRGVDCGCSQKYFKERAKKAKSSGICKSCGQNVKERNIFLIGIDCGCVNKQAKIAAKSGAEISMKPGVCSVCGEYNEHRDACGIGIECGCKRKQSIEAGTRSFEMKTRENVKCAICHEIVPNVNAFNIGIECGCASKTTAKAGKVSLENRLKNPGSCAICHQKVEHRNVFYVGYDCGCSEKVQLKAASHVNIYNHKCQSCGFEEENTCPNNLWKCPECRWVPENSILGMYGGIGIDREEFYKKKLELIKFEALDKDVFLSNIDSLKGICGVWAIYTVDGACLDVCKTVDVGSEMLQAIRIYNRVSNGEYDDTKRRHRKFKQHHKEVETSSGEHLVFKLVAIDISEEEALLIEAQYAHDNKALYWSPEPNQTF